jgi:hypothetical protein
MSKKPKDFLRVNVTLGVAHLLLLLVRCLDGDAKAAVWLIAFGLIVYAVWLLLRPDDDDFTGYRRKFRDRLCLQGGG